jgi:uncharacterized repeat protein (TIGR01451 family)
LLVIPGFGTTPGAGGLSFFGGGAGGAGGYFGSGGGGGGAGLGGAIFIESGGVVTAVDMNFSSNSAKGGAGGVGLEDGKNGHGGGAYGGAIFNMGFYCGVNTTFSGNEVVPGETNGPKGNADVDSELGGIQRGCDATTTTVAPATVKYSTKDQKISLSANLTRNNQPLPGVGGTMLFSIYDIKDPDHDRAIGTPLSVPLSNAAARADFTLPAGTPPGNYSIEVVYGPAIPRIPGNAGKATLTVLPDIAISPATLSNGSIGKPYWQALTASGGTPGYTFKVSSGNLPAGLTLVGDTISGTPTGPAGTSNFTIQAQDALGFTATQSYTVLISSIKISPESLPQAKKNEFYSQTLTATGGTAPYTFTAFNLGNGLKLSGSTISGTPTVGEVIFPFNVQAKDANGFTAMQSYLLYVSNVTLTPPTLPNGIVGSPYSQTLTARGGFTPYKFSIVSGNLPPGLALNGDTIKGTPSAPAGKYTFTVEVIDDHFYKASQTYTVTITNPNLAIDPATLPSGSPGKPYSQRLTVSGGLAPYTLTLTGGSLPPGLTLNGSTISGTPTGPIGKFNFTVQALDSIGSRGTRSYEMSISNITINPVILPAGAIGEAYSQTLTASGGVAPYKFSIVSGSLPPGLGINGDAISGTPSQGVGNYSFTVQAQDANGTDLTGMRSYTLSIYGVSISPATLPNGSVGVFYRVPLTGVPGAPPFDSYSFRITNGQLPPSLTLSTDGVIFGTPMGAGTYNFEVFVRDLSGILNGRRTYTLVIANPNLAINPATLPKGAVGTPYVQILNASGGQSPYTFGVINGALPAGLKLAGSIISGMPTGPAGTSTFTIQAQDNIGSRGTRSYQVTIIQITLSPATLPNGSIGMPYIQTLTADGGTAPYQLSVTSGNLPPGLLFTANTIIGIPTGQGGSYTFTIQAQDTNGLTTKRDYSITIAAVPVNLIISPATLPDGQIGVAYPTQTLDMVNGIKPILFHTLNGNLPTGLMMDGLGVISGTPSAPGAFTFTVRAECDLNYCSAEHTYTITIAPSNLTISTPTLPNGTVGVAYPAQTLAASGGTAPYTFSILNGNLPAGLILSGNSIFGTPSAAGQFTFTLQVQDANNITAIRAYTLTIAPPVLSIGPGALPAGVVGTNYPAQTLTASGGTMPYTFSLVNGALPPGLLLTGTVISGTPSAAGQFTFTVQVQDAGGFTATRSYTVQITDQPVTQLPAADLKIAMTVTNPLPSEGEVINFVINYGNAGPATAKNVTISVPLPAGVTLQSANGGGSYNPASGLWTIGDVIRGQNATLSLQVKINAGTRGNKLDIHATISSASPDPNPANNTAGGSLVVRR